MSWQPRYTFTPRIVRALMEVEAARAVVERTPLPPAAEAELRRRARLRATHYSTRIEGNRLTLAETEQVIERRAAGIPGRERDVAEVRNYWNALARVEEWAGRRAPLTEDLIRRLHALVEKGPRARPTAYRDGQNVIRDAASRAIVYLPPEAGDVPGLMRGLVEWVAQAARDGLPVPVIAALVHYQFVTIHPNYDGNGRTARLLATFILQRGGYGLNGFFSLEEYHAIGLDAYYRALVTHPHHNYYEGRAGTDLTSWLDYFIPLLARVYTIAQEEALRHAGAVTPSLDERLRRLDPRARRALGLFASADRITASEVATALGISTRSARRLLIEWVQDGWLVVVDRSNRARAYELSASYRSVIGHVRDDDIDTSR